VLLNNNIKSRIDDDSWIDLSHTRHFALLPNLSICRCVVPVHPAGGLFGNGAAVAGTPDGNPGRHAADMAARSGNATGTALGNNRVCWVSHGRGERRLLNDRDVLAVAGWISMTSTVRCSVPRRS
jgi:hypothetical protein